MVTKVAKKKLMLMLIVFILFLCYIGILLFSEIPRRIIVGLNEPYPPYTFTEGNHRPLGIFPEIIDEAAKIVGIEMEYVYYPWARMTQQAEKGNIDAVMGFFKTPGAEECYEFSGEGLIYEEYSFFTWKGSGIKYNGNLDVLKNTTIGVVQNFKYGNKFNTAVLLKKEKCPSHQNLVERLIKKRFNIAIGNKTAINYYANKLGFMGKIEWLSPPVSSGYSHVIAFSKAGKKSYSELAGKFADAIKELMENGKILQILKKYNFDNKEYSIKLVYNDWSPYYGPDLQNQGPIAEIITQAFNRVGYTTKTEYLPFANLIVKLKTGRYDAGFATYYSDQRAKDFIFSDPIGVCSRVGFIKKKDSQINFKELEDLKPYRIGVTRGYIYAVPEFDTAEYLNKIESTSEEASIMNLIKGRLDLVIIDKVVAQYLIGKKFKANRNDLDFLEFTNRKGELYLFISKANKEADRMMKDFNDGLKQIKEDGTFDRIIKNYEYSYETNKK
jgi:polar amino acid transport system substrate-binding protein